MKTPVRHFPTIIELDEDNVYIVSCPLFEGCHAHGNTIEEAMENLSEVIEMCLEEQQESEQHVLNRFVGIRDLVLTA